MANIALRRTKTQMVNGKPIIQQPMRDIFIEHVKLSDNKYCIFYSYSRVQHLMVNIALRRTKTQMVNGKPIVQLPMRDIFIEHVKLSDNNSNFTNFLHYDWLFGRLYTSIKAMRKNTQFSP